VFHRSLFEGVEVITIGQRTANPSGISRSRKLFDLLELLKTQYDYVLVDTAPYGIITDAAPMLTGADGVLLVARFNETKEADFDQTVENLRGIRANILGSVMIGYNPKKATGHYYSSSYYRQAYTSYNAYIEDQD